MLELPRKGDEGRAPMRQANRRSPYAADVEEIDPTSRASALWRVPAVCVGVQRDGAVRPSLSGLNFSPRNATISQSS